MEPLKKTFTCFGCGAQLTDFMPPLMPIDYDSGWIQVTQIVKTHGGQGRLEREYLFCSWDCFPGGALAQPGGK